MHSGRSTNRQSLILCLLAIAYQPDLAIVVLRQLRRIFAHAIHRFVLDGIPDWASSYRLFTPLYGLMASRYRRGDAVTPAPGERDLHPHDYQVVKVVTLPAVPEFVSFRLNESHHPPSNK